MSHPSIIPRRLGRLSPSHTSISTGNYTRIPPAPFSYIPRHRLTFFGTRTTFQLSNPSLFPYVSVAGYNDGQLSRSCLSAGTAHQNPSAAISALKDSQPNLDERYDNSETLVRSDSDSDFSHECQCQGQECCIYDLDPAVPTTASYHGYPTPASLSNVNHPLSSSRSSELQQHIPASSEISYVTNKSTEFFAGFQDDSATSHHPVHVVGTFPPDSMPGIALSPTFHQRGLGSPNAVTTNEPIDGPVDNAYEGWYSPSTERTYGAQKTTQLLDTDRDTSNSHMALSLLCGSQKITMSHNARSPSPRLHSNPNHPPTSPPFLELLSDSPSWDSPHPGQEAASPAIRFLTSVPQALPQRGSINVTAAEQQNRCSLCGIHFTQSQVLNRHIKDKHEDKESCAHCSNFKWSRGRPYSYRKHLRVKHPGDTFSDDRPGGTRKVQVSRARRLRVQVTSRGLAPNQ